jgi:hypothetical protein
MLNCTLPVGVPGVPPLVAATVAVNVIGWFTAQKETFAFNVVAVEAAATFWVMAGLAVDTKFELLGA